MTAAGPTAWGIEPGYHDTGGQWHEVSPDSLRTLLAAMKPEGERPPHYPPVWVVTVGDPSPIGGGRWQLDLEDGAATELESALPPDLPLGYHRLTNLDDGHALRLVVSPRRCHLPPELKGWGWSVQLPCLRSGRSWGMGDLADLRDLGRWARSLGARMVLLNPLHAARPGLPQEPSPYSPASRRARNLLYLRIEDVPGWESGLVGAGGAPAGLEPSRVIDRDAVYRAKRAALEAVWSRSSRRPPEFERWRAAQGAGLEGFATWCALVEAGLDPLPHPSAATRAVAPDRVDFHAWVQWLLDRQLAGAGAEIELMQDLAVGFDPEGADAWQWQDLLATGARIGAPPDEFNQAGQDWGLPPLVPWKLQQAGYEPFVQTVRAGFRHAGGLRVDHVMGLFRLYWVPTGEDPAAGAYVRYPAADLLGILALESVRAGAYVVGEDLGTVEDHVRAELHHRGVLSYRVLWFEDHPPETWPEQAMAAVTTHDLPTVAGLWTGADLEDQRAAGVEPNVESLEAVRRRLQAATGLPSDAPVEAAVEGAHALLARSPSALLVAALDDLLAVEQRPNLPGTTSEARPNWSIALPASLEDIVSDPRAERIAALLRRDTPRPAEQ